MKTKTTIISIAATMIIAATACSHFPYDDSGDYGRNWRLVQVDTLSTGKTGDYAAKNVFWAIQGSIFEITEKLPTSPYRQRGIVFHYDKKPDSLILKEPRYNIRLEGDPQVEDIKVLQPFGVNEIPETLVVEKIGGDKMTLRSKLLRLRFKSF